MKCSVHVPCRTAPPPCDGVMLLLCAKGAFVARCLPPDGRLRVMHNIPRPACRARGLPARRGLAAGAHAAQRGSPRRPGAGLGAARCPAGRSPGETARGAVLARYSTPDLNNTFCSGFVSNDRGLLGPSHCSARLLESARDLRLGMISYLTERVQNMLMLLVLTSFPPPAA